MTLFPGIPDPDVQRANRFLEDSHTQAFIPLDPSRSEPVPTIHALSWTLSHFMSSPFQALMENRRIERRQDVRHLNVNGTGWQAVRELSENCRPAVNKVFDHETLEAILPPGDQSFPTPDPIIDSARYKTLIGLMLQLGTTIVGEPR